MSTTEPLRSVIGSDPGSIRAFLGDGHLELAERAAAWAADQLTGPEPEDDAAARVRAREIARELGAAGWLEPIGSADFRACCLLREVLAAASPLADAVFALQALAGTPLLLAGEEEVRRRWIEPALRGEAVGAFAMTEPEVGSDVAAIGTRAVRDGDGYLLDGRKSFISNAGIADFYVVFASTDPEAGRRGLSAFLVPASTAGLRFLGPQVMAAPHPLGEVALEGCRVPVSHRLGEEGDGYRLGMATLDRLRPTVGAAACGMAGRALREALRHALVREQFGRPLAEFQLIQEKLGRMATELAAARLLVYRAAWERDGGTERTNLESAMAKAHATEVAQRVVDEAVQILGGRGVLAESVVDRLYRSVRALRIYEGTTEMQRLVVAGALIERARAELDATPTPERESGP